MTTYFVITWRSPGGRTYFFRGDSRREVFLPYIKEGLVSPGWVESDTHARIFDTPILLTEKSYAKNFRRNRLAVYPYVGDILPTHLLRPTKRFRHHR